MVNCPIDTPLNKCYYDIADDNVRGMDVVFNKTDIDGVPFSSCADNGIEYTIEGEQGHLPCFGHTIDIPHTYTPKSFQDYIEDHKTLLLGRSARGLNIEATLYSPDADYWAYVQVYYEYSV